MSRKTYTAEFKVEALHMLADQGLVLAEVARRLGVSEGCLRAWRDAARDRATPRSPAAAARRRATRILSGPAARTSATGPSGTC